MTGKQGAGLFMCMFVTTVYDATVKQGGGASHGRVFVTTVYDATGNEGAGLLMVVSLLLPTGYDTTGKQGACLCDDSVQRDMQ